MTVLAAALMMSGCAMLGIGSDTVTFANSPDAPAAEGKVTFSLTKNDNTRIALKVKHLAHPDRLRPVAGSYVVWTRASKDQPAQNIGALRVDDDLTGTLDAETPLHSFDLFITAETSGQIQQPSEKWLLWMTYAY